MKKRITLNMLFLLVFSVSGYAQEIHTIIKGKVHNWPTDTIYLSELPFHSPYSRSVKYQLISDDSTFTFQFEKVKIPFVLYLSPDKKLINQNFQSLLFDNLTDKHYYGHCAKFYTHGLTTHLIGPGEKLEIDIIYKGWDKAKLEFTGSDSFQNYYYQKSFALDNTIDKRLELYASKSMKIVIAQLKKVTQKLLARLEKEKEKLSPLFYDYIKAEIEFGARKEFLKFLRFSKETEMQSLFSEEIPKEIMDVVEFDKSKINEAILISEEYNEYLELYLNFKMNIINKKHILYNEFSMQKCQIAIKVLPEESIYYYLANHLIQYPEVEFFDDLVSELIKRYPEGELNDVLLEI
ncbi:hypothetical protein QQ008_24740 [Fulvivirgaceae bacterium BMA10]|uniref:DUF4369 domain-containing protein n=1 Tax=Splendidivirga corallicola TaxID=3051826 RepID=A0ABT8KWU0_9BACT|nr:hypothetical protein [Fulvivirgaceae bacterium BMA10]